MPVPKVLKLTDGHNDVVRSDLIGDGQVKDSQNYEVIGDGDLTIRKEPDAYSSTLNTYLSVTLDMATVLAISPPFYPPNKPSAMVYGEFMLVVYGTLTTGGSYEMYLVYEKTPGVWTHLTGATNLLQGLTDAGVDWDSDCDPEFSIGSNRIVITDGVNRAYYIAVDADGDVQSSILGIPSPTNKPYMIPTTGYDASDYTSDENNYVSAPGLVQVSYTSVTEDGLESNPSPLSDTLDLQWFNFDANLNDDAWIAKVNISNLTVPDVAQDILDELKYFKIYIRTIRNSGGTLPHNLEFVQQFDIIDKSVTSATVGSQSGNAYAVTLEASAGEIISYENDIAPIAAHNAQNGGVIMLGGTKSKSMIGYPWEFGYYHEIILNNQNAETFIDAIITISIDDEDVGGADDIDNLDWDYYLTNPGVSKALDQNVNALRMYDTDGITPLQVAYNDDAAMGNVLICHVKIPMLQPGSHPIYLCFSSTTLAKTGVTNSDYQTAYDGQWMAVTSEQAVASALLFTGGEKVGNLNTFITSPIQNFLVTDELPNKASFARVGALTDMAEDATAIAAVPVMDFGVTKPSWYVGANSALATASYNNSIVYDATDIGEMPLRGTAWFRLELTGNDSVIGNAYNFFAIGDAANPAIQLSLVQDGATTNWKWIDSGGGWGSISFSLAGIDSTSATRRHLFIAYSWDAPTEKISLFIYDLAQPGTPFIYEEISMTASMTIPTVTQVVIGDEATFSGVAAKGFREQAISQFQFRPGIYLSGANQADRSTVFNLLNFMPLMRNIVGYYLATDAHNQNITFTETKEFELKSEDNKFKWSDVNGVNFPDLYSKRLREPLDLLAPAPSFLKFQYENTMVILTRNTINRFIMAGDPSTWAADPNRLIQEAENYGLYAKKSFSTAGERLLWMGEDGVVLWDPQGLQKISQEVIDIPLGTASDFSGFFQPVRDQYILHNFSTGYSYVFHFKGNFFYKFKDLLFEKGIGRVLSGGTLAQNINLLISTQSGYSNSLMTTANSKVTSGANDWVNVDIGTTFTTNNEIVAIASAQDQYFQLPVASAPTISGVSYRLVFDVTALADTWTIKDFTNTQTIGTITATGAGQTIDFTASTPGGFSFIAVLATSRITMDNIYLYRTDIPSINKYPGATNTTTSAYIKSKDFNHRWAEFLRWLCVFDDGAQVSSISTVVDAQGTEYTDTKTPLTDSDSDDWKWIVNGKALGGKISFTITGPDTISYLIYEYLNRGVR
jgi:hypothetical protein